MRLRLACLSLVIAACGYVPSKGFDAAIVDPPDARLPSCGDAIQNQGEEGIDCGGPCTACVACTHPTDCPSGICTNNNCTNSQLVSCTDAPPENAASTSTTTQVPITFDGSTWSSPEACPWACNGGTCPSATACPLQAAGVSYAVTDDAALIGGNTVASEELGLGESLDFATATQITGMSVAFTTGFYDPASGGPAGVDVTVELDVRDGAGTVIATATAIVPADFTGGAVHFDVAPPAQSSYILTWYVPDALRIAPYFAGIAADTTAGFAGVGYQGKNTDTTASLTDWSNWFASGWDFDLTVDVTPCP